MTCYLFDKVELPNGSTFNIYKGATKTEDEVTEDDIYVSSDPSVCWDLSDPNFVVYCVNGTTVALQNVETMSVAEFQKLFLQKANTDYAVAVAELSANYTQQEQDTWQRQVSDAEAYLKGEPAPFLENLAAAKGKDAKELATAIQAKSKSHEDAKLDLFVQYSADIAKIKAAKKVADLPVLTELDALLLLPMGSTSNLVVPTE
ncbi:hypothetical protein [Burkholderia phage BCSR5]|nr:hypothetical protein [Burkholderia phage BCSR5]